MRIIYKGKRIETPKSELGQMCWGVVAMILVIAASLRGLLNGQLTYDLDGGDDIPYDVYTIENE